MQSSEHHALVTEPDPDCEASGQIAVGDVVKITGTAPGGPETLYRHHEKRLAAGSKATSSGVPAERVTVCCREYPLNAEPSL